MTKRLDRARNLYLRGIRDGDLGVIAEHTGDVYIQHSSGVADGVEGFTQFFEDFIRRNPDRDIDLVRSFEDDNGAFVHAHQILNGGDVQWVTMDWFRFDDDDKIVEHWDVIAPYVADNPSGHSSVDGSTEIDNEAHGPANAELVTTAIRNLWMDGGDRQAGLDVVSEDYIEHDPDSEDGRAVVAAAASQNQAPFLYQRVHRVCAHGNFVATLSEAIVGDRPFAMGDLYRIEDRMIAEHWVVAEAIAPQQEWANTGKF